jgi:phenylacetate-CoA ligase
MTRNLVYWSLLKAKGFLGKELREIESVKNEEDLERFIEKYLETLLMHAYHHVKYYKKVFEEISIFKNGEIVLSEFNSIPILTKSIIRQYRENLISDDYMKRKWYYNSSGGSTGEPVRFIQDDIY